MKENVNDSDLLDFHLAHIIRGQIIQSVVDLEYSIDDILIGYLIPENLLKAKKVEDLLSHRLLSDKMFNLNLKVEFMLSIFRLEGFADSLLEKLRKEGVVQQDTNLFDHFNMILNTRNAAAHFQYSMITKDEIQFWEPKFTTSKSKSYHPTFVEKETHRFNLTTSNRFSQIVIATDVAISSTYSEIRDFYKNNQEGH